MLEMDEKSVCGKPGSVGCWSLGGGRAPCMELLPPSMSEMKSLPSSRSLNVAGPTDTDVGPDARGLLASRSDISD